MAHGCLCVDYVDGHSMGNVYCFVFCFGTACSAIMPCAILLCVIMLSVIMLSVIMLSASFFQFLYWVALCWMRYAELSTF